MKISADWQLLVQLCQELATQASTWGDVPVGALVVQPLSPGIQNTFPSSSDFFLPTALDPDWLTERLGATKYNSLWEKWQLLGVGANQREIPPFDPTAHAEILALRQAANHLQQWRLSTATLVVSLEPCLMCAGAALSSRIKQVVFGAWDEKAGACGSHRDILRDCRLNHQVEVIGGVREISCSQQLTTYFQQRR